MAKINIPILGSITIAKASGKCVAQGLKTSGGLYKLMGRPSLDVEYAHLAAASTHADINLLHRRLGHLGIDTSNPWWPKAWQRVLNQWDEG